MHIGNALRRTTAFPDSSANLLLTLSPARRLDLRRIPELQHQVCLARHEQTSPNSRHRPMHYPMTKVTQYKRRRGRSVAKQLVVGVVVVTMAIVAGSQMTPPPLLQTEPTPSQKPRVLNGGGAWNFTGQGTSSSPSPSDPTPGGRVTRVRDGNTIPARLISQVNHVFLGGPLRNSILKERTAA